MSACVDNQPIETDKNQIEQKEDFSEPVDENGSVGKINNFIDLALDCTVRVSGKSYRCLSEMLCTQSTFFKDNRAPLIVLPKSISSQTFVVICAWMALKDQNHHNLFRSYSVVYLLDAAQLLGIPDLKKQCTWFINNPGITGEHQAYRVYKAAKKLRFVDIMQTVVPRINAYFLFLVGSGDYLDLDVEDVVSILSSSNIRCHSEIEVFMSAVYWLVHDWIARRPCTMLVMRCVRFNLISPMHLIDIKYPKNRTFTKFGEFPDLTDTIRDALWVSTVLHSQGGGDNEMNMTGHMTFYRNVIPRRRNFFAEEKFYTGDIYNEFLTTIATCHRVATEQQEFDHALERRTHKFVLE